MIFQISKKNSIKLLKLKMERYLNNVLHRYCPDAKNEVDCDDSVKKNWLKFT